jgi:hypothetical protein
MFHVEPKLKTLTLKGFSLLMLLYFFSCATPRQAIDVSDYVLRNNGKEVPGNKGLTAFIFENNPKKIPFSQFLADKYNVGKYIDVEYNVTIDGHNFKVMLYENAELEKYFQTSNFIAANVEPDSSVVGSKAKFLALSVINDHNEDCLAEGSLYQNMIINYLKNLKKEYYNS